MKLNAREATRFIEAPDRRYRGVLIYGEDGADVSRCRADIVAALIKDEGDDNVTRLDVGLARRDPAAIADALRSRGFFGGQPVVIIENGTDGLANGLSTVIKETTQDDAFLVVTAGVLPARSKLRKLFESDADLVSAPRYANALGRQDVEDLMRRVGMKSVSAEAMQDLADFARVSDRSALSDLITRLHLYSMDDEREVSSEDVLACLPNSGDAAIDDVLDAIASGQADQLGGLMAKLESQGVTATSLVISAARKFRQLHAIAAAGGSPEATISRLRPPVFGPRRDALIRQARLWGLAKAEGALQMIIETDSDLRGGAEAAGFALLERMFIRLALAAKR